MCRLLRWSLRGRCFYGYGGSRGWPAAIAIASGNWSWIWWRSGSAELGRMGEVTHRFVDANGLKIHIAEQGSGPVVLLLHGFPESWYSWRHQLPALAAAGFHAVAPDLRGFGDTEGPESPEEYTALHLVGDFLGLLDALGAKQAFVVGHDFGAIHGWDLCLLRPDRVKAAVMLSVPFLPRLPIGSIVTQLRQAVGEGFYMARYQEKGVAEALYEKTGYERVLKALFLGKRAFKNQGNPEEEDFTADPPEEFPLWFTEQDLTYFVDTFKKSGFTTPLNHYRSLDRSWELKASWNERGIPNTPALFIIGKKDLVQYLPGIKEYLLGGGFKALVPKLKESIVVDGASHFIQQERPELVSAEIIRFFREHSG